MCGQMPMACTAKHCPLHPDVHKIVFDLVDEICNVFETDAFHAGMDEVFTLVMTNARGVVVAIRRNCLPTNSV